MDLRIPGLGALALSLLCARSGIADPAPTLYTVKVGEDGRAQSIKGKQGSGASIPSINIGTDRGSLTVKKS